MSADQKVNVDITANAAQANAEMNTFAQRAAAVGRILKEVFTGVQEGVTSLQTQTSSDLGKIGSAIEAVQKRFALWAAMLSGGAVAKEAINATVSFTKETLALSRSLGINTSEASALNVALGDIGQNSEVMTGAASKMAKQLRTNEDQLRALGLQTRDADGNFRNMNDLLMDAVKIAGRYAEGTDRMIVLQQLFGKGADDINGLMKLNAKVIEEARKKQEELGLVVGVQNIEAMKGYRKMMNDVGDVLLAVKKAIGDALMPVFTKLSEWFTTIGPAAVIVIKGSIGGLVALFWGLKEAAVIVAGGMGFLLYSVVEPFRTIAIAFQKLVEGDFKGAADAIGSFADRFERRFQQMAIAIADTSEEVNQKIYELFNRPDEVRMRPPGDDGLHAHGDIDKTDRRMAQWEARLEAQKAALTKENALNDTFYAFGLEKERDYWAKILAGLSANDKLRSEVERKYFALVVQIGEQTFQARQAETQREIDDAKGRFAEQDALMAQYVARARDHYGEDSKQYQDALRQQQQLARQHAEALQQIAAIRLQRARDDQLEEIAGAERNAQLQRDLGLITEAQLLVIKQGTIAQRGAIEEQAKLAEIEAMKGNPNMDPVALERLEAELAAIRARYRAAGDENQGRQQVEGNKRWDAFFGTSQSALEEGLQSMVEHMKITLNGLRDVARQVGAAFVQELITKPVAEYVIGQARLVALTALYGKERVASEGQTAAQIMAIQAGMALRNIAAKAAEAAANVYASISQIPIVGPFLAPAAAAAALAAVGAFAQRIFSAEGGYDIPRGMNPLVQAHSGEMVLPARHADVIRQLADSQAVNRGGGGNVQVNLKVDQVVRPGVYVVTSENLHKAIKEALRNNVRLAW